MRTVLRLLHCTWSVCLRRVLPVFSSEMGEKLIELLRKCEELYDMSNKKYRDSVWGKKLWGQIGEELKKSGKFHCFFYCALGIYSHSIITEVPIINK